MAPLVFLSKKTGKKPRKKKKQTKKQLVRAYSFENDLQIEKTRSRAVVELRMVGVGVGQFWHRLATFFEARCIHVQGSWHLHYICCKSIRTWSSCHKPVETGRHSAPAGLMCPDLWAIFLSATGSNQIHPGPVFPNPGKMSWLLYTVVGWIVLGNLCCHHQENRGYVENCRWDSGTLHKKQSLFVVFSEDFVLSMYPLTSPQNLRHNAKTASYFMSPLKPMASW